MFSKICACACWEIVKFRDLETVYLRVRKSSAEFQSQDSTVFAGGNKVVARKIYIMVCTGFWTGEFG